MHDLSIAELLHQAIAECPCPLAAHYGMGYYSGFVDQIFSNERLREDGASAQAIQAYELGVALAQANMVHVPLAEVLSEVLIVFGHIQRRTDQVRRSRQAIARGYWQ